MALNESKRGPLRVEHARYINFISDYMADNKGAVHVRPFGTSTNFTSLELSTITGSKFPEPFEPEKVRPH